MLLTPALLEDQMKFSFKHALGTVLMAGAALAAADTNCERDCRQDFSACLSQIPASDPEHQQARHRACEERYVDCMKNCRR